VVVIAKSVLIFSGLNNSGTLQ